MAEFLIDLYNQEKTLLEHPDGAHDKEGNISDRNTLQWQQGKLVLKEGGGVDLENFNSFH